MIWWTNFAKNLESFDFLRSVALGEIFVFVILSYLVLHNYLQIREKVILRWIIRLWASYVACMILLLSYVMEHYSTPFRPRVIGLIIVLGVANFAAWKIFRYYHVARIGK